MRKVVGFSCSRELAELIDARAASLHMNRSNYISQVLRQELLSGRPNLNIVAEQPAEYEVTSRRKKKRGLQ